MVDRTPVSALRGSVVEDELELSLLELCRACDASLAEVRTWVVEGVIEPSAGAGDDRRFPGISLSRVRVARRLARDFEISASAVALVLDLLDRIAALEARLGREGVRPPRP
ncbi:MAG: chaperone modulator CbpM [Caldimonas sp.]